LVRIVSIFGIILTKISTAPESASGRGGVSGQGKDALGGTWGKTMITTMVLPRLLGRTQDSLARVGAVTARNLYAVRHFGYWLVVIAGFFEPVLYLMAIGVGVGGLIRTFTLADGTVVSYAAFVAPAMLAASAMNGALAESTFNFFARMKWMRLYDAMVATPLNPFEIATGELGWALIRGAFYSVGFLTIMIALGLTTLGWAVAALVASTLVGFAFGGIGMALATTMRTWQDFDYVFVIQFALFLLSGTFAPVESYPIAMQAVIEVTPLYQSVELIRDLTTGRVAWATLGHVAYLIAVAVAGLAIAARRMNRILCT
jgi:lipooligosaccharide transport system permease protein